MPLPVCAGILCLAIAACGPAGARAQATAEVTQWGSYGTGLGQFSFPWGIDVDANGLVYVADGGNSRIQVFDSDGAYVTAWGSLGSGPGQLDAPCGVAVDASGRVYVTDSWNRLQVFDGSGAYLLRIGATVAGTDSSLTADTQGIALDKDGSIYVACGISNYVFKFTRTGQYVARWFNQLSIPMDLAPDGSGRLYTVSTGNSTVVVTDTMGGIINVFGGQGTDPADLDGPRGIAVLHDGNLLILDTNGSTVKVFDRAGGLISSWGGFGSLPGQFNGPSGIAVGPDGAIYVADTRNHRIQRFRDVPVPARGASWGSLKVSYR